MRGPSARKMGLFLVLSLAFWALGALLIALTAISSCSMSPDFASRCDSTPISATAVLLLVLYGWLSVKFFRSRISGIE